MTIEIIALLAVEDMIDMQLASKDMKATYIQQNRHDSSGKYADFYQSKEDLRLGNPFLSVSMNLDGKPLIVQHLYNFESYKSMEG